MKTSEKSFYFGSVGRWSVVKFALRFEAASIEAVFQYQNQYVLSPSFFRHVDIIHYSRKVRHYGQDWIIIPQKCGDIGSNGFYIKWIISTHVNWKNQNLGGRFGATSWTALPIWPIWHNFEVNGLEWQCCLAGSSKTAPRILIFSIAMGADCSFYVKSIAT